MNEYNQGQGILGRSGFRSSRANYPSVESTTLRKTPNTINTTMGLKSKPPKLGKLRRTGPRIGSVIRFTNSIALMRIGWGRPPLNGIKNERITRANMAIVNRVSIAWMSPANI